MSFLWGVYLGQLSTPREQQANVSCRNRFFITGLDTKKQGGLNRPVFGCDGLGLTRHIERLRPGIPACAVFRKDGDLNSVTGSNFAISTDHI